MRNGDQIPVYSIISFPYSLALSLLSPFPFRAVFISAPSSLWALPPARPLSPLSSSEAECPLLWGSLSPSSTQEAVVAELGTWDTEKERRHG